MKKSHKFVAPTAIALLTLVNLAPVAIAYPGNRERYDCYRKNDNQFGGMDDSGGDDFGGMDDSGGDDFGDMDDFGGDDFGGMDDFGDDF